MQCLSMLAILVFVVVTIARVRIEPQGEEWIVERLGKYHGTPAGPQHHHSPPRPGGLQKLVTKDIILTCRSRR